MNGEGIMALPQDMAMPPRAGGGIEELDSLTTAQQIGRDLGPTKVSKELLSAGADVDPYEVKAFLDEIRAAGLTADDKEGIREIVRRVKAATPAGYQQVRQELLSEGAPEDLLPEVFDPEFFIALELAVESDVAMTEATEQTMPVQGFAQGGIVELPQMKAVAAELAKMGRGGDTILAHITPEEASLLKRRGGAGTINPYTGLPEYLKKAFKKITRAVKKVGKAVKKFAKSTVGRIVIGIAAGMILGPAAIGFLQGSGVALSVAAQAGITAGVGAFSSGILAGDGFKNSLKAGVVVGTVAAAGTAAFGGSGATATPTTPTGPQSFSEGLTQGWNTAKASVNSMLGTEAVAAPAQAGTAGTAVEQAALEPVSATAAQGTAVDPFSYTPPPPAAPVDPFSYTPPPVESVPVDAFSYTPPPVEPVPVAAPTTAAQPVAPYEAPLDAKDIVQQEAALREARVAPPTPEAALTQTGAEKSFLDKTYDFFSPSARAEAGREAAREAYAKEMLISGNKDLAMMAYKEALPGVVSKYAPLAAAGLGVTYLAGGMKSKEAEPPGLITPGYTGEDYMRDNPEFAAGSLGTPQTFSYQSLVPTPSDFGTRPISSPGTMVPTGITALPTAQRLVQEYNRSGMFGVPELYRPVYTARKGSGPQGVTNFPRKTGPINGPGTGTSDSIPAMLSDGEFVFTAKAVRNMGGGSRRKGAARMYKMMKMLEGGPVGIAKRGK